MIEITDEETQRALDYLITSAIDYKDWKSRVKYLEKHHKSVLACEALKGSGKISENKLRAEASEAYKNILLDYKEAVAEFTLLEAYRNAAETKIELYRTMSASLRRGNV